MNKISINLICALIIVILGASIAAPLFKIGNIFYAGFMEGFTSAGNGDSEIATELMAYEDSAPVDIEFVPDIPTMLAGNDSIAIGTSAKYPVILDRASVLVPEKELSSPLSWTTTIFYIVSLVLFILLMIEFIKFIININKGVIFDEKNVKRLTRFSYYLISIAILRCAVGIIEDIMISNINLEFKGYTISAYWSIPWSTLLLGLLALLMAKVWSRGLDMEKEQELTI